MDQICKNELLIFVFNVEGFVNLVTHADGRYELKLSQGKLLQLLLNFLDVPVKFISYYGRDHSEILKYYYNGSLDIGVGKFIAWPTGIERSIYSNYYEMNSVTFAVEKSVPLATRFAFLYPFTLNTWMGFLSVLILFSAIVFFLLKRKLSYFDVCFKLQSSLFGQSFQISIKSLKIRLLILFWLFFAMVVSFSYTAVFFSFMVSPLKHPPVKNFKELSAAVAAGTHKCYIFDAPFVIDAIKNSGPSYMKSLSNILEKNDYYFNEHSVIEDAIFQGNIIIRDSVHLNSKFDGNSKIFISDDKISYSLITPYFFGERLCLKKRINTFLSRAISAGLYQKILQDEDIKQKIITKERDGDVFRPLSLHDLSGVFLFLISGLTISFLVFITETIAYRFKKNYE